MGRFYAALLAGAAIALPGALFAQAGPPAPVVQVREEDTIDWVIDRGRLLYAYDRAAWLGTDDALPKLKAAGLLALMEAEGGGWIVEGEPSAPVLTFFATTRTPRAIYRATFADHGTRLVDSAILPADGTAVLTPTQLRLIAAQLAARRAVSSTHGCSRATRNIVVVPPVGAADPVSVYLLTPQTAVGAYPLGGHVRVDVDAAGRARPVKEFAKSCMMLDRRGRSANDLFTTTHFVTPLPTELHVFTALASGSSIGVLTMDKGLWMVDPLPGGNATVRQRALEDLVPPVSDPGRPRRSR